ncbi:hypothetical protein ACQP00_16235 [Dactylosporangium sp. CS-047395]|uniref:hypothetical protein n=1 Tax=Dactylosporangium sp. CS-047395 TaxID=3239936 RepID=UPI003D92A8AD
MMWPAARCPVREEERAWIEHSLGWLSAQFGRTTLFGPVLTPSDADFPGVWTGSTDEIEALVARLCAHVGADRSGIALEFEHAGAEPGLAGHIPLNTVGTGAAGHYHERDGCPVVTIREDLVERPTALVATLAHELGHVRLLGERRAEPDAADCEPLTDLATVFFGLGLFAANAALDYARLTRGDYAYSRTSRLGYLTEPMYGYALARYAWLRGEPSPEWARFLDTNPRTYLRQGLRYLARSQ